MIRIAKPFCRLYQKAFRAALPLLPYREPEIYNSIAEMVVALKEDGFSCVMMVTDKGLRTAGVTEKLERLLQQAEIQCVVYDGTCANPTFQNAEEAKELYLKKHCQALIAFGGGSSMDCAKAAGSLIVRPNKTMQQLKGNLKIWRKLPRLIAIPTTAGTGSEVTLAAVLTDEKTKRKYTMNAFPLISSHAVLDPEVTYTLPPHLTATTGVDAMTHAIEAYIGRSTSKETRRLSLEAVKLVFDNVEIAYHEPQNREARENMLHAAYKAGIAFSKSYVGYIHAIAHSLGGQYSMPHGLANSVLLPVLLEAYGSSIYRQLHELGVAAGVAMATDSDEDGTKKFIEAIKELNRRMNIPETLPDIKKEDISHMAKNASREGNPLYPVPVLMDAKELEQFYYKVADWS